MLQLLDPLQHRPLVRRLEPQRLGPEPHVPPPGHLAHDHPHLVPDRRRIHVLVALGHLGDRGDVDAALVGERAAPDVRRVRVGMLVGHCGHELGDLGEPAQGSDGSTGSPA